MKHLRKSPIPSEASSGVYPRHVDDLGELATGQSAAGEFRAAATGTGKAIDGGPSHPTGVPDPGFTVGSDASEERHLPEPTVGLRPIPLATLFKTAQVKRFADRVNAVSVAIGIHAGQQIRAARTGGERRGLAPGGGRS